MSFALEEALRSRRALLELTKHMLREHGVRASKRRGQNFSISPRYLETFRSEVAKWPSGWILEVGTGLGTLTYSVAAARSDLEVISVECDERLFGAASVLLASLPNVSLVLADALELLEEARVYGVFTSAPFSVASLILLALARNNNIQRAVIGVQREVARRLTARPGSREYGRLTVVTSLHFRVKRLGDFDPGDFYPEPEVCTTVVALERRSPYERELGRLLEKLSACVFSARNKLAKKVVHSCLRALGVREPEASRIVASAVAEDQRCRDLSPELLLEIARNSLTSWRATRASM
ncbi:MAG: rRNA adenine dimethyltransferase family protein [Fervidicoccaceae archaeon]